MDALERRYARWAQGCGLVEKDMHRFEGRIAAREIVFTTGLGGSGPNPPQIVVVAALEVAAPMLLTRADANVPETWLPFRAVLDVIDQVRNVGLTPRFVRITFEPGVEDEVFDAALDALDERLRTLSVARDVPYRG